MKSKLFRNPAAWLARGFALFCIIVGPALLTGCAAALLTGGAAAGAGAIAYVKGDLQATESVGMDKAWDATLAALKQLELHVSEQEKDALSAKAVARGADDKKIQVTLKRVSDTMTEISIRVGLFGEESTSRLVMEKIRGGLK